MKNLFYPFFLITFIIGLISCDNGKDTEKVTPQDIASLSEANSSNRVIFINGIKLEKEYNNLVEFTVLDTITKNNDQIYEANMELVLPGWMPIGLDKLQFVRPMFHVTATSSEESIIFSGNCPYNFGTVNYSVEGYLKHKSLYKTDTLYINTKRTATPSIEGKTYELTLDENTFNFSDFDTNESVDNRRIVEYGKEGMLLYIEHLKAKTNDATYRFTFMADGKLNILKKDASMADFESIPGEFSYYIMQKYSTDRGTGVIELPLEVAQKFDTLLKGSVIPGSSSKIYEETSFPSNDKAFIPFKYITQFEELNGLLMLALGDWGSDYLKLIGPLYEWRRHSTNYDNSLLNEAIDVFITNWIQNSQTDNLWWNLKKQ